MKDAKAVGFYLLFDQNYLSDLWKEQYVPPSITIDKDGNITLELNTAFNILIVNEEDKMTKYVGVMKFLGKMQLYDPNRFVYSNGKNRMKMLIHQAQIDMLDFYDKNGTW